MIANILSFLLQVSDQLDAPGIADAVDNAPEALRFLGIKLINSEDFFMMLLRFGLNLLAVITIIRGLYYPKARRKDYLFTYLLINVVIFILCFTLNGVKLQMGFALGLFAVFGIIKYRTDAMPIKEMTYLFTIIGIAIINALTSKKVSYAELLFANGAIIFAIYALEHLWLLRHESSKEIVYERIDLILPEKREEMKSDIERRTGLTISRLEVGKVDFMRDVARVVVYYYNNDVNVADGIGRSGGGDDD